MPAGQPLHGPWEVRFAFGQGAPRSVVFDTLLSWGAHTEESIRYYSGIASYHHTFRLDSALATPDYASYLDLGRVAHVAEVYLNGHRLDVLWQAPYVIDISTAVRPGYNHLVVEVANTWRNRLIGDARTSVESRVTHTNITRGPNAWMHPLEDLPPGPAGLLGPVMLRFAQRQ
jgi:hypothetical protein